MNTHPAKSGSAVASPQIASAAGWRSCALALWERIARLGQRTPRRLRLAESLSLGERRFVAVVECEGSRFLLGGTASSLVLLARLQSESPVPAEGCRSEASGE